MLFLLLPLPKGQYRLAPMNRDKYYSYIEERLATLCYMIEQRGKLNVLNYHLHSENFYRDLFNLLYGWNLENLNVAQQNVEAIDLIDNSNKIIVQISATNTKAKIDNALSKPLMRSYGSYTFKFISIAKSAKNLRGKTYTPPVGISFNPMQDIYDLSSILKGINSLKIGPLKKIYDFVKNELGVETQAHRLESNLTSIIKLLAKEDLANPVIVPQNSFEIDRKIDYNKLTSSKRIINEYKIYHNTVDGIYSSFDEMGQNKSISVLNKIRKIYLEHSSTQAADDLFALIVENIKTTIKDSTNFDDIPDEELELCVDILVVDSFVRCKIFENPAKYDYASS